LLSKKQPVDIDRMLEAGRRAEVEGAQLTREPPLKGWRVLRPTKEFTKGDKAIYLATYTWTFVWVLVFVIGTIYNLTHDVANAAWMKFWEMYFWIYLAASIAVTIGLTAGGVLNLKQMIVDLRTMRRDHADSGYVRPENH
jgi:SSS family solute:Na+ symporter